SVHNTYRRVVSIIRVNEYLVFFFFFQAEDGIRDLIVTGVQTCALPIYYLLTVGDDAHPVLRHTLADEIIHRRLGPALAERQVVLVGASLVAVALDEHQHRAVALQPRRVGVEHLRIDRKSTRLNSSHDQISYAG